MTNGQTSQKLNLFDVTNLVIGGTVGADIYIVASLGSAYLGPASLLVWLVAGAIAIILALNFAEAAALVPTAPKLHRKTASRSYGARISAIVPQRGNSSHRQATRAAAA